jgi:peptidoglycan hydrolase-like protein with peptidoglycan-binding domain
MAVDLATRASRSPSARRNRKAPSRPDIFAVGMLAALLGSRVLREGDSGSAVREVQRSLAQLGHALEPTGRFDEATKAAAIAFQSRHALQADGQVDRRTAATLDAALAGAA